MPAKLNKKRILVTRPREQSKRLSELISEHGGKAILFPTIEIRVVDSPGNILADNMALLSYDFVLFVSRNAVNVAFDHYLKKINWPAHLRFVAIGAGTAEALSARKIGPVLHAGIQADSETLLKLPELQSEYLAGKKVLIIRGVGGREYLADNLTDRGALVDYAEVYERCLPQYEMKDSHDIWQDIKPGAVIATSNEGLNNLVSLTAELDRPQLFSTPLVLMSARSVNLAKESGFISEVRVATDKNDEGLLSALLDLVGEK